MLCLLWCLVGSGQTVIYEENFTGQNGKGAVGSTPTIDLAGVDWDIDISSANLTASTDWFQVQSEVFEGRDLDGNAIWLSPPIDISSFTNVSFSLEASEQGTMEGTDEFITEYRINGGSWITASINGSLNDDFTSSIVSQNSLSGNTIEIKVTMDNDAGVEYHRLDNIKVVGTPTGPGITLSAVSGNTAENGATATFTAVLDEQAATDVVLDITSTDTGEITVTPTSLTFTIGNWDIPQVVTATGVDDEVADGDINVIIDVAVVDANSDDTYDGLSEAITVTNEDDEAPPVGWQITVEDTAFTIDFDTTVNNVNNGQFDGSGFTPIPAIGQLNSGAWSVLGFSFGDLGFGGIETSNDFARGNSIGGVNTGGIYSFETSPNNFGLGIQPAGSDFTPGELILRIQNKTGTIINAIKLSYLLSFFNDQERANSFNFSYSLDDINYTDISTLDLISPDTADSSPSWQSNNRETTITGLSIPSDGFFFFKWTGDDVLGVGERDEFALDDIEIRVNPNIPLIMVSEGVISNLNYEPGEGPSASQSFLVSGENLQDDITIYLDPSSNFEISSDDSSFSNQITVNQTLGVVSEVPVYVRLKPDLVEGNYTDVIESSSLNADSQFVQLNGRVKQNLELFITEIANPSDIGNAKYIELFNAGVDTLDLSTVNYYFSVQFNGGNSIDSEEINGKIPPKGYYIIESSINTGYEDNYSAPSNFPINSTLGNGDDSYFLSTSAINNQDAKDNMFDVYGEIDRDGSTEAWEYSDSRIYRNNPNIKNSNIVWESNEWVKTSNPATPTDMTPGYGDNDYIYVDDIGGWTEIGLGNPLSPTSTGSQNIFIRSGEVTFDSDVEIGDLVVRSGATLELDPGVKLTVKGDIVNEGTIIFKSGDGTPGDISTAVLEAVQPNTRVVGSDFEIHRRIPVQPGFRAFRYLSSSVDTQNSNKQYVRDNWQQGGLNPGDSDYEPGFGTHITGSSDPLNTLGFDATDTGNPSMFSWSNIAQNWSSIPNTNATSFAVGDAYAILIRGDRTSPLDTNDQTGDPTTLRTTGKIHVGDFTLTEADGELAPENTAPEEDNFNLIGNPYQSQVDLEGLLDSSNPNSQGLDDRFVYIWDPTLGTLGGYATVDLTVNDVTQVSVGVPEDSDANQYLQPQQAFFIKSTGVSPSLTFTESDKNNSEIQTTVFSTEESISAVLDVSLKDGNNKTYDGLRIVYDDAFSNAIDNQDAIKFWNYTDHLALLNDGNYLSIEKRSVPITGEATPLYFGSQSLDSYSLEFQFYAEDDFNIYLIDNYTEQSIAIPAQTIFNYDFSVDSNIPESMSNTRFEIVYNNPTLSTEDILASNFSIYPNPLAFGESLYIQSPINLTSGVKSVELLNLNGQVLEIVEPSIQDSGHNLYKIDFKYRPARGTYLLKIRTNQNVTNHKIMFK